MTETTTNIAIPQPHEISMREKEDAMGAYLMMFAALGAGLPLPFFGLIAAVIYHLLNSKKSRFVAFHSMQSMITESIVSLMNTAAIIWAILIWQTSLKLGPPFYSYLVFTAVWNLLYIVYSILACIEARKGHLYYYPIFGRIAFNHYFSKSSSRKNSEFRNEPPGGA